MKTYESIIFNDRTYKGRRINIEGYGNYLVASRSLSNNLLDENYNYKSEEAKQVDENIFFFINPVDFKLSDALLAQTILKSL